MKAGRAGALTQAFGARWAHLRSRSRCALAARALGAWMALGASAALGATFAGRMRRAGRVCRLDRAGPGWKAQPSSAPFERASVAINGTR